VLDCPGGTFQGAGVKTVVLFFEKGAPTRKIWFYQLDPGRNLGKTNPLNDDDLAAFIKLQKTFADCGVVPDHAAERDAAPEGHLCRGRAVRGGNL
jgi:type I restriction-modification system DNA methylase subunit